MKNLNVNLNLILMFLIALLIAGCGSGGGSGSDEDGGGEPLSVEPSAGTFTMVSAGADHTCGILDTGAVACWGLNDEGQSAPPAGTFTMVSSGAEHTCGILDTGAVKCWGLDDEGRSTPPAGAFTMVSAGGEHTCGILDTGTVACWGLDDEGQSTPPAGTFTMVSAGAEHTCGILETGAVACWGLDDEGQSTPPAGTFTMVSAGVDHTCGILDTGAVACWGLDDEGQSTPPAGTFTMVSAGEDYTCGILDTGAVACWGLDDEGQSTPPAGIFITVNVGGDHACGILDTGAVACWSLDDEGQSLSPGRSTTLNIQENQPREQETQTQEQETQLQEQETPTPEQAPDLVVLGPNMKNSSLAAGESFTLTVTVHNQGTLGSAATTVRYYRSTDATITTSDTELDMDAVNMLVPSGRHGTTISLTAPPTPSTYYYGGCVDAVADESDATNNCSKSVQVTVQETQPSEQETEVPEQDNPDLTFQAVSVLSGPSEEGYSVQLIIIIANVGKGASAASTLRYFRSTDATITNSDIVVDTAAVPELAAAGTSSHTLDVNAPSSPGTYYYGACVDEVTGESDTANNCSSGAPVVVPEPPALQEEGNPDLTIGALIIFYSPGPFPGGPFSLVVGIRNNGDGASTTSTLRYYRSTDATITTSDTQVDTVSVAGLAASESTSATVDLTPPTTPGTYYFGACVDTVMDESDTTNNCSTSIKWES